MKELELEMENVYVPSVVTYRLKRWFLSLVRKLINEEVDNFTFDQCISKKMETLGAFETILYNIPYIARFHYARDPEFVSEPTTGEVIRFHLVARQIVSSGDDDLPSVVKSYTGRASVKLLENYARRLQECLRTFNSLKGVKVAVVSTQRLNEENKVEYVVEVRNYQT